MEAVRKTDGPFAFNLLDYNKKQGQSHTAIVLPGAGYNYLGPILYYPMQWMLQTQRRVIVADYDFRFFEDTSNYKRLDALRFALRECLLAANGPTLQTIWIIGKSIGTRAMCHFEEVAKIEGIETKNVSFAWLTPVWLDNQAVEAMQANSHRSLYVVGSSDPDYSLETENKIRSRQSNEVLILPDADHSLDIDSDLARTLEAHQTCLNAVIKFFSDDTAVET